MQKESGSEQEENETTSNGCNPLDHCEATSSSGFPSALSFATPPWRQLQFGCLSLKLSNASLGRWFFENTEVTKWAIPTAQKTKWTRKLVLVDVFGFFTEKTEKGIRRRKQFEMALKVSLLSVSFLVRILYFFLESLTVVEAVVTQCAVAVT